MPEIRGERGLTPRAFIVGSLLVLVWLFYDCTLSGYAPLSTIELLYLIGFGAVFTLFAVTAVNHCLPERRRLTPRELTIIYAMVAVAIPWGVLVRGALESPIKIVVIYAGKDAEYLAWMKSPWCIESEEAIDYFRRGGIGFSQIPWKEWMTPMVYWGAMLLSFQAFAIFVVLLFRRHFVEEEKLPFPLATVGQSLVEYRPAASDDPAARKLSRAVRVAFVVGLAFCVPGILSVSPESHGPIPMNVAHYGTNTGLIPRQFILLSWDPFVLCFLIFFPIDVLLTAVVFRAGLQIVIPAVLYWLGIHMGGVGDLTSENWMINVLGMGGLVGLAFWTVFFNRGKIADAVKRGWRGTHEADGSDPTSPRVIVVGLVLSFAAFTALFVYGLGDITADLFQHVLSVCLCLFVIVTLLFSLMRLSGEAGWHYHSPWSAGKVIAYPHAFPREFCMPDATPIFRTPASYFAIGHTIHFGAFHNVFGPHLPLLYAFKVAYRTGTSTRDVMKAVVVTLLVSLPLVMFGYLVLIHHYGFEHGETAAEYARYSYSQPMIRMAYEATPTVFSNVRMWLAIPMGMAIVGIVMYLRREHVRFPLSPVGVVVAAAMSMDGYGTGEIWFSMLIVLGVKWVIYRWFGVGFFRDKVLPVVVYAMMGLMTGMFIYKVLFASMGFGFLRGY